LIDNTTFLVLFHVIVTPSWQAGTTTTTQRGENILKHLKNLD